MGISDKLGEGEPGKVMYRYEYSTFTADGINCYCYSFDILSTTNKGKWIDMGGGDKRWVANEGKKRYAYETKEDALTGYLHRQIRREQILTAQLRKTTEVRKQVYAKLSQMNGIPPLDVIQSIFGNKNIDNLNNL